MVEIIHTIDSFTCCIFIFMYVCAFIMSRFKVAICRFIIIPPRTHRYPDIWTCGKSGKDNFRNDRFAPHY